MHLSTPLSFVQSPSHKIRKFQAPFDFYDYGGGEYISKVPLKPLSPPVTPQSGLVVLPTLPLGC